MNRTIAACALATVLLVFGLAGLERAVAGPGILLLEADFDDKTVDQEIDTGGASMNEPVSVDPFLTAFVRNGPFTTPSLEISDNHDFVAGAVRFELIGSNEIVDGALTFEVDLWFAELEDFAVSIREPRNSAHSFLTLRFTGGGSVSYNDTSPGGTIGSYEAGRVIPLKLEFNQNAGTYDIWLDGQNLLNDRAHGVTERGIGAILFVTNNDADLDGTFSIDNLIVTGLGVTPTAEQSWSQVKDRFR